MSAGYPGDCSPVARLAADSARALMPRIIRRSMAKSPSSISSAAVSPVSGCRQSYQARMRTTSRVPPAVAGVRDHAQVLAR
jgi:hypothetical protein